MRVPHAAFALLALLSAPAAAQQEVVVTGKPLSATERELAECLARNCPPDEDIAATLAHAENLFVAGDYDDARSVLYASMGRNDDEAKDYPVEVSYLNRGMGRVAAHLGNFSEYHSATWGILRALKEGISEEDYRHLGARLEIARMMAATRGPQSGIIHYDEAAEKAEALGRPDIAMLARLRSAWLSYEYAPHGSAKRQLEKLAATPDPALQSLASSARIMLARIAAEQGDESALDALLRQLTTTQTEQPILVHAPDWELPNYYRARENSVSAAYGGDDFDDEWVDVGFWVQPDGKVAEAQILRRGGDGRWADSLMKSVEGRIYSPSDPAHGGFYRVERYTLTSKMEKKTGTRIARRSGEARIEYLDLTQPRPSDSGS